VGKEVSTVKPWQTIATSTAPDGAELVLARRDEEWVVRADGRVLMSSRQHGSEEALAKLALERAAKRRRVLVGGLGLGFSLRAVLDRVPVDAFVEVVELLPALVEWNRQHVSRLAGRPLDDRRVHVTVADVRQQLRRARTPYDVILLDVDNGPAALAHPDNDAIYGEIGLATCHGALAEGGVVAVWSAQPDERFLKRLGRAGFEAEAVPTAARGEEGGPRHVVFLGVKRTEMETQPGPRRGRRS
jgi:spermidine synthase